MTFAKLTEDKTLNVLEYIPNISNPSDKHIKEYAKNNGYKIVEYHKQPIEYSYFEYCENDYKIIQIWKEFTYDMVYEDCMNNCQILLDTTAQSKGYDNIQSLISYVSDKNSQYAAEAKAGKTWRSNVWTTLYDILNKLKNGEIQTPKSWSEIKDKLPKISWPNS